MRTRWTSVAAATAVLAGTVGFAVAVGTAASAATSPPPWEPDASARGQITFYNASGAVIRSGSTSTAPFFAYAVGNKTLRAGDKDARIELAAPAPGVGPALWFRDTLTSTTKYPLTTGPTNVKNLSQTLPVVTGAPTDLTIDDFVAEVPARTDPAYANIFQVRLVSTNDHQVTTTYDDADILVDPAKHTWTQIYPVQATKPGAPSAVTATPKNAAVALTWKAPTNTGNSPITGYSVQYSSNGGTTWRTAPAVTKTSTTISGLTNGTRYVFRVAAKNVIGTGPYTAKTAPVIPRADASAVTISGPTSVKLGKKVTITGKLTDSVTKAAIGGAPLALYGKAGTAKTFSLVKRVTTGPAGFATFAVAPRKKTVYQWRYAGTPTHKAATSPNHTVTVS